MPSARFEQRKRKECRILPILQRILLGMAITFSGRMMWLASSSKPIASFSLIDNNLLFSPESSPGPRTRGNHTIIRNSTTEAKLRHPHFSIDFPLCLVHVGKAAGSSVSCGLGLTYADCEGMPRDALNHTHYFHLRRNTCPPRSQAKKGQMMNTSQGHDQFAPVTQSYLVTLRNPITRLRSWFEFEKNIIPTRGRNSKVQDQIKRKRAMLFQDCFTSFEKLVVDGLHLPPEHSKSNWTVFASKPEDMTCVERAWAAVMGVRAFSYHEWFNYEYYWTGIVNHGFQKRQEKGQYGLQDTNIGQPALESNAYTESTTPKLYALRTEHLQDDWRSVSVEPLFRPVNQHGRLDKTDLVGTPNLATKTTVSDFKGESMNIDSAPPDIIDESTQFEFPFTILCQALCPEIQFYKLFLQNAVNLNNHQLEESISELQVYCPSEAHHIREDCHDLPVFPLMKVPAGKYRSEIKKRLYQIKSRKT